MYNIVYYMLLPLFLDTLCNIVRYFAIFLFPFCDLCCIVNRLCVHNREQTGVEKPQILHQHPNMVMTSMKLLSYHQSHGALY